MIYPSQEEGELKVVKRRNIGGDYWVQSILSAVFDDGGYGFSKTGKSLYRQLNQSRKYTFFLASLIAAVTLSHSVCLI